MKQLLNILTAIVIMTLSIEAQTLKELSLFPEDYLGKTITFTNGLWYPTLIDKKNQLDGINYYQIALGNADENGNLISIELASMSKIQGVVKKSFAKKLTADGKSGEDYYYWGSITGKVVKAKMYRCDYFFIISKIESYTSAGVYLKTYTD